MTIYLRNASWIGLAGLLLLVSPALAQEPEKAEPKEKSLWEAFQDKSKSMLHGAESSVEEAGKAAVKEAKEKYFPIIREAGYEVSEIRLTFGLSPTVEIRADRVKKMAAEKREALLRKYQDDSRATGILETIFVAERVEVEGLELTELIVTLGVSPRASVVLSPIDG